MNRFEKAAERLQTSTDDLVHVEWAPANPAGVRIITCGVDVQKDGLYYVIRGWGVEAESWLLDHGFLSVPASRLSRYRSHDGVPSVVS